MKRWFLPVLILLFAIPCWPKVFAQSPTPEIKPGKNSVAIRGHMTRKNSGADFSLCGLRI